jgi:hypothetical protein
LLEITVARQWKLNAASPRLIGYVEHILQSMEIEALNSLKTTKFQIAVVPSGIIWAYFPVHKSQAVVKAHQIELLRLGNVVSRRSLKRGSLENKLPTATISLLFGAFFPTVDTAGLVSSRPPAPQNGSTGFHKQAQF